MQASGKSRCIGQEQRHQRQRQVKMQVGSHAVTLDMVDEGAKVKFALLFCLSPLVFVEPLFNISHEMIMPQIFTKVVLMSCMFGTHK